MQQLDTDVANADAQLQVLFYTYQGEGMWNGKPHVRIIAPGDKLNINDRPATEYDKARFQRQWLYYQQGNADVQVIGTPLAVWRSERPEELSDGQLQELLILKFLSVEQVAMASDAQVQRVGMGAQGLRERARSYLNSKNAQASGAALKNAEAEIETLKAQMAALLTAQKEPAPITVQKKKGGGWNRGMKFKKKGKADVQHDAPTGAASL